MLIGTTGCGSSRGSTTARSVISDSRQILSGRHKPRHRNRAFYHRRVSIFSSPEPFLPVPDFVLCWERCRNSERSLGAVPCFVLDPKRGMLTLKQTRLLTIIGLLVPLEGLGGAVILEVETKELEPAIIGGVTGGRMGGAGGDVGKTGSTGSKGDDDGGSSSTRSNGAGDDPEKVLPVSPHQTNGEPSYTPPGVISSDPPPAPDKGGTTPVTANPPDEETKMSNPAFIGNVGWVAPGVMTNLANSVWQESQAAQNPRLKADLNGEAVVEYLGHYSALVTAYNDALLTRTDNSSIQNLLSVLAGGSYIESSWSQAVLETALSADIISHEINTAWQDSKIGGAYVSYTQLHDNINGTICNGTHIGVRSTQVCADGGVYYLNVLNTMGLSPSVIGPPGFDSLVEYGIMPWWPVSASATAYRILNPNSSAVPPIITTTNGSIFSDYMNKYITNNSYSLVRTIGQMPTEWSFPLW